ncbi:hypothetical protein V8C34DRAFT_273902 [Trichoderma compactum]
MDICSNRRVCCHVPCKSRSYHIKVDRCTIYPCISKRQVATNAVPRIPRRNPRRDRLFCRRPSHLHDVESRQTEEDRHMALVCLTTFAVRAAILGDRTKGMCTADYPTQHKETGLMDPLFSPVLVL